MILKLTVLDPCGSTEWSHYDGNCYFYEKVNIKNQTDAENDCVSKGAHLASVHSSAEAEFIVGMVIVVGLLKKNHLDDGQLSLGGNRDWLNQTWIGGERLEMNGTLSWTDGTEVRRVEAKELTRFSGELPSIQRVQ